MPWQIESMGVVVDELYSDLASRVATRSKDTFFNNLNVNAYSVN